MLKMLPKLIVSLLFWSSAYSIPEESVERSFQTKLGYSKRPHPSNKTQIRESELRKSGQSKFFIVGRIPPGRFEYPSLNGFYKTDDAVKMCTKDPSCAGFTYKGTPIKIGTLAKQKYFVYFFHYVPEDIFEDGKKQLFQYYHWTSYIDRAKEQVLLNKVILQITSYTNAVCLLSSRSFWDTEQMTSKCPTSQKYSAYHLENTESEKEYWSGYPQLDFKNLAKSEQKSHGPPVYLNLRRLPGSIQHSLPRVDRCCKPPPEDFGYDNLNQIERISCEISKPKFFQNYVRKRQAVILMGCQKNWKASNWTFEGLLNDFPDYWSATYQTPLLSEPLIDSLSSKVVEELFKNGTAIKLFNRVWKNMETDELRERLMKKAFMQGHYNHPDPLPQDLYIKYDIPSEQGYFMAGSKGTGTELHIDPDVTDAWNGVIIGSKWWACLPKDLYEAKELFTCDPACSNIDKNDLHNSGLWFYNILPQLRNLTFYGEQVKSFILRAGEVIYMPHFVEHIVYNPEFTVAIGENLLFSTAMEEVFVSMPYNLRKSFIQRVDKQNLMDRLRAVQGQTRSHKMFKETEITSGYK